MSDGRSIISQISERQDRGQFRKEHWVGSFAEYLDIVRERPEITRNAFQRDLRHDPRGGNGGP